MWNDPAEQITKKCPHERVQYCPLYVAGHECGLATCMDKWDYEGCDVDHGRKDYGQLVAALSRQKPEMITECADAEWRAQATAQRERNMRAASIH
jgi:hypothetical protein